MMTRITTRKRRDPIDIWVILNLKIDWEMYILQLVFYPSFKLKWTSHPGTEEQGMDKYSEV